MFTVLQRHVSTHMSHLQARTILVYKVTVLILGSQTLTCLFHRCYLGLSHRLVCAAPLEMNEGTHSGKSTICLKAAVL